LVNEDVLRAEQDRLQSEEKQARVLLEQARLQVEDIATRLEEVLEQTRTPHETYRHGNSLERRLLNQTFFMWAPGEYWATCAG
jgi:hypothetical protein